MADEKYDPEDIYGRARMIESFPPRPKVVCLCGSTRFYEAFQWANYSLTMSGHIVLSVGFYPHSSHVHGEGVGCSEEQKHMLDVLHLRKIDLADEIFVLNVNGYIGESTRREIAYAEQAGKPVKYLLTVHGQPVDNAGVGENVVRFPGLSFPGLREIDHNADRSSYPVIPAEDIARMLREDGEATIPE